MDTLFGLPTDTEPFNGVKVTSLKLLVTDQFTFCDPAVSVTVAVHVQLASLF